MEKEVSSIEEYFEIIFSVQKEVYEKNIWSVRMSCWKRSFWTASEEHHSIVCNWSKHMVQELRLRFPIPTSTQKNKKLRIPLKIRYSNMN